MMTHVPSPSAPFLPGRLAMVACAGLLGQHAANGLSPLEVRERRGNVVFW